MQRRQLQPLHALSVVAWLVLGRCSAWIPVDVRRQMAHRRVASLFASNLFGGSDRKLPKDVKEAVSQCRSATQQALEKRISRMTIDFPIGTKFGVEAIPKTNQDKSPTSEDVIRSNRELARIIVDMFQPVGGDRIAVSFPTLEQAEAAKKKWKGDSTARARVLTMDRRAKRIKKKSRKTKGFAAKLAEEIDASDESGSPFRLPDSTEVAVFVAPSLSDLSVVATICNEVGMGTLVILLNARLWTFEDDLISKEGASFAEAFEEVFHLAAAAQKFAPGCMLYRKFPENWSLARKPAVGAPKTIMESNVKPTDEECGQAFESFDISEFERGVETMVENVASWLN